MIKKIKIGIVLILIGIGIPSVMKFFYQGENSLNIKIRINDKLREEEVKTLNSVYDLSKGLLDIKSSLKKISEDKKMQFEPYADLYFATEKIDKTYKEIDDLWNKAYIPHAGRWQDVDDKSDGLLGLSKFSSDTEIVRVIFFPFNYFIGIGLIFIITGIGFVVLPLIGGKRRERREKEPKQDE
jgi:hypothetical protein